jgi:DNA primase
LSKEKKVKLLKNILGSFYTRASEHLFHCPKCEHHKKKLSINLDKGVFKCWVCDWSGKNIYRIVRNYGTTNDRYEWKSFDNKVEIENFTDKLFSEKEAPRSVTIDLPNSFISLANKNLPNTARVPLNYLKSRGIDKKDIAKWKIGYCPTGKYASRVVVPSFNEAGAINYFVTRTYANDWKKYYNPVVSKDIIFNYPYVDFDEDLIIVEGVFDAIVASDNAVPLLGSTLSEKSKLFYEIVKNDTPVFLALDPDAHKKTSKLISLFLKYDIETRLVDIDPYDDVGSMTKNEFKRRKEEASILTIDNYLLSKIAGL